MCITKTCAQNITGFNNQLEWSPPQAHQIKIWLRRALNQSQNVKIKFVFTFPLRKQHNNNWTLSQKNNNWTHRLNSRRAFEMCFFFPDLSVEPSLCYCKSGLWSFTVYVKYQHPWSHTSLSNSSQKKKKKILAHQWPICHDVKDLLYPQTISILNQSLMMEDRTIIIYTISWFVRIFFISLLILRGGGIYHKNYIYIYIYIFSINLCGHSF